MPRKTRYTQFHLCHHVMLRGNGGQRIFSDDEDRARFCLMLQKAADEHLLLIHAFCFMSNHIHLVLEPTAIPLSKGIHAFAGRYALYFNRRHKLRGHLFQDRYRSIIIEDGTYLMRLVRYIHLNPVRAKIVGEAHHYRWSSYQAYLGSEIFVWLNQHRVLHKFGASELEARQELANYTSRKGDAEIDVVSIQGSNQMGAFGNDEFIAKHVENPSFAQAKFKVELDDLINATCSIYKIDFVKLGTACREKELVDIRSTLALAVRQSSGLTLEDLANRLGRDSSSLGRLAKRAAKSETLSKQAEIILSLCTSSSIMYYS